ncbi:MAG TPA: aminotransferase class I/II-fold pyridoxal phosphate-dependent enzyme, partial [Acidimicrobiia bacterium]
MRKHAGLMISAPVQAAAAAALADDDHVGEQQRRYARRRAFAVPAFEATGLCADGGPSTFYLWLRDGAGVRDGWAVAADLAATGLLVAPGEFYGDAGRQHVRVALTVTDEQLALACGRFPE